MSTEYHHGDLPTALRAAAVDLIAERGPAGFSLREVARRAGVSHAAPAHHFGDAQGLLTSVAAEGFATLTDNMVAATQGVTDPRERLIALGTAYVDTAFDNPAHYALMVTHEFTDENEPELAARSIEAFTALMDTVELLRDQLNPDLDLEATAILLWATVHGLVELSPNLGHVAESTGTETRAIDTLLATFADTTISGITGIG